MVTVNTLDFNEIDHEVSVSLYMSTLLADARQRDKGLLIMYN
ncbi:hypothetical protein FOCG_14217 [Fusarium oxysporum f. sp. radicis-lycopersici 26381]|uniref:Uncharacterized protein n=1 Tax=Fusarium oxysporum Fo47 TaxID=660027 RepID=W9LAA5_FUSOX|nr:hypothetical protein FOZG_01828 [Fusarium oxysporum Fo47]EWZ87022.1 hypothetical protein FOWG_10465 [Fusarium oxysporum f. sp. lycopersici MN25]EXL43978.1 hypothetical protein FOCG_14217 [Fusarium oxysporum f. sp. radicis-lycopersici 26381]